MFSFLSVKFQPFTAFTGGVSLLTTPNLDTTVPVLIFKSRRSTIHHGALGIVPNLGGLGVPVYVIVEDRYDLLAMSRYLTGASGDLDNDHLLNEMVTISKKLKRPTILVPFFRSRKMRSYPPFAGITTLGVSATNEQLAS